MKNFNSFFNSLVAMPKRLAMVLTVLFTVGVGSMLGETETVIFTASEDYSSFSGSPLSLTKAGVTISGFGSVQSSDLRLYKGGTLNISSTNTISSIEFTFTNGSNNGGWNGTSNTYAVSGLSTKTWSKTATSGNSSKQARITKIIVKYESQAQQSYSVVLDRNGAQETINNVASGTPLDDIDGTDGQGGCAEWSFVGWSKSQRSDQDDSTPMDLVTEVDGAGPYYAVYSHTADGGGGFTTKTISSFSATSGTIGDVSYTAYQGGGTSNPQVNTNAIRLYQNADGKTGGYIVLSVPEGYKITSATIKSTMATTTGYYIASNPGSSTPAKANFVVSNKSLSANTEYTVSGLSTQYITFACFGTSTSSRLYLSYLSVTYSGGQTVYYTTTPDCEPQTPTYTITWKNADGTILETDNNVESGATPQYNGATPTKAATAQYTYTFAGWDPEISTVIGDQIYTAKFTETLNKYTITWKNSDGTTLKTEEVAYGTTPSYTGTTPTKAATEQYTYTHNGWTPTVVAVIGDAEYTATFAETPRTYTITLHTNDGTIDSGNITEYTYGLGATLPTDITKGNLEFAGWYDNETCDGSPVATISTTDTGNKEFWAKWEKSTPTFTWSADSYTAALEADNTFPTLNNPDVLSPVTYTSSNTGVATIDEDGNITLVATGTTTITATGAETATHKSATTAYTLTVNPSNCRWVEVTDNTTLEDGDWVVIAMANGENIYALPNNKGTSTPDGILLDILDGNKINTVGDYLKWTVEKTEGNYIFHPNGNNAQWLYCRNENDGVCVGTGDAKTFILDPINGYLVNTQTTSPRYLRLGRSDNIKYVWRCYTTNTAGQTLKFYKRECLDATNYWVEGNLTNVTCTQTLPQQIAKSETLALNFEAATGYALPDNVTVTGATPSWNKATGTLTISNPTANVTITIEALKLHTINWMVGSSSVLTEEVANGTGVTQTPTNNPEDGDIGSCANAFIGWTETPLGSAEGQSAPADLCTAAQMKSKHTSVTGDKTFYAVFATKGSGGIAQGTVLWAENFAHFGTNKPSTAGTGTGTTIYGDASITYSQSSNNTKGYNETHAGGTSPELLLYKGGSNTWTIAGIPTGGATKMTLSFLSNKTAFNVTSSTTGITISGSQKTWNIEATDEVTTFTLTIKNTSTSENARIDNVSVVVAEGGVSYSNYVTNCCATPVPTNGSYTSPSGTSVTLTWDGESTRYHITCANPIIDDHTECTSYEVSSLTECEEYTFYVSADPKEGCESEAITITAQPFSGAKTVTFNYNGNGQANTTSSTSCGNTSITLPTPAWTGYRFMGWFNAASDGTKIGEAGASYTPTSDITLYAHWAKEYTVTYNANGGSTSCTSGNYIAGETVTICTTNPTKTGYTFAGWTYSPEVTITDGEFTMPASDVTITAQWTINQYTVTWKPNGGNWAGSTADIVHTYDYGAAINRPADPTRDEYRFTGWNATVAPTMPANNITYTAQWKQNYTITFHDGDDTTPWTQTKDAESINLTEYVGTLACDDYQFAGWSTDATKYDDEPANITTWVTGNYTPTANIDLYAVYTKGAVTNDFTLNCAGGVYEIWEKGTNKHMAGRQDGGKTKFYTTEYWDANNSESNGAPFTITKVADNTYTLQNADGQYITCFTTSSDDLSLKSEWENSDLYKWTVSEGTNGTWRFTNNASTTYALVFYSNYFQLRSASTVTSGSSYYDLELTPAASNVYQSNPNCGPYYIIFNTHGGEFIQGEYAYGEEQTGLTETTYSKFPAAELEGYTFAGWKDGSPIDDEITADNASDAPYLKQAGEDLVVSSNKTYHAVYYYYDEEEDIDFSKEFTTSIYAEVNGMKYFLAGTPSSGTMSSTTDCGYVSEVTITPGTGANAGKYKITVNGEDMAPEAGETDLVAGTAWWTITETSVGSGEYKISGEDKRNIVLRNSSFGHYSYNAGSSYGAGYYYPRFGKCLQHHWTSNPTLKPSLNLSGDVYVTATNARGIMATSTLKVSAKQLNANEKVNITSNSNDVYFSADCTVNFVKANKPTNTLTITASPSGVIEQDIYVHYKPSAEGNGTPASVVVSANLATPNPSVTDDQTIYVRNLPAKFVIATKVGATWYALPADMSSATNPLGVVIEVDETTMTTIAPNTTTYTLWPVKTTATENDRYTNITGVAYGDRVRFAAVNYEQKGLWANNNNNGSTIRNFAVIDALGDDGLAGYEWKITTTVVDGHWQYTLQTDQTQNQNYLRYWTSAEGTPVGPKWGTYNAGENKLYFLPVTETKPFDYKVVEWYPTKVLIQTEAAITNPIVKIGGVLVGDVTCTNKGGKLYEISNLPLETNPNKLLQISFTDNAINYINTKVVPIILSRGEKTITGEPFATLTQKVYQYADVVVRDGATLSIDGTTDVANTLLGVTIYPTAKVSVEEGKKLSVHSLTFFGGIDEIYNGSTYEINKYGVPQLSLKGILNKTITNMDYIMRVDLDQMYSLTVPYDVQLADIKYWDGSDIALGTALYVSAYDGAARANQSKKTWIYETDFESKLGAATLKAGVGYTISAELQAGVGNKYSILRMPMMSNVASGATEAAKTVAVTAWGIDANITENHKGWNLVGNPYMTAISGGEADTKLVLGYLKETGTGPWEWVEKTYRYVTIPADNGKDYSQQKFTEAVLPPFKNFFVQVGTTGELVFDLGTRQSMPARSTQAAIEKEVEFEILMSNDARQDNTGLLISEEYSPAYEINADLEKMIGSMSVYTIYGGYKLAYNALSPINASEWIPMGYIAPAAGEYTFCLDDIDKIVEQVEHVYLIDYEANNIVDLMDDEYEFTTDKEQNNNRFAINIVLIQDKDNTTTGMDIINGNVAAPIKFIYHDKMYIQSGGVIYDGTGKQVTNINK